MKNRADRLLDLLERAMGSLFLTLFAMCAYLTINMFELKKEQIIITCMGIALAVIVLGILIFFYVVGINKDRKDKK